MTNEHPVENLMKSTMENLRNMIDVNTIIGETIETRDGSYIIPISKVTFGFASGGSEFASCTKSTSDKDPKYPFGGGSGAGVTVKPVAFLILRDDSVRVLPVDLDNTYDRLAESIPQVFDIIKGFFNNKKEPNNTKANVEKDINNCQTFNSDESPTSDIL